MIGLLSQSPNTLLRPGDLGKRLLIFLPLQSASLARNSLNALIASHYVRQKFSASKHGSEDSQSHPTPLMTVLILTTGLILSMIFAPTYALTKIVGIQISCMTVAKIGYNTKPQPIVESGDAQSTHVKPGPTWRLFKNTFAKNTRISVDKCHQIRSSKRVNRH